MMYFFLQNISSFSEKDFNVVDWINHTLKDKPPDQCREVCKIISLSTFTCIIFIL